MKWTDVIHAKRAEQQEKGSCGSLEREEDFLSLGREKKEPLVKPAEAFFDTTSNLLHSQRE